MGGHLVLAVTHAAQGAVDSVVGRGPVDGAQRSEKIHAVVRVMFDLAYDRDGLSRQRTARGRRIFILCSGVGQTF